MPDGSVLPHAETATSLLGASPKIAAKKADAIVKTLGFPNAYTLSKHLAEDLVAELHTEGRLNACIVRPSIVGANAGGPAPGKEGRRRVFLLLFVVFVVFVEKRGGGGVTLCYCVRLSFFAFFFFLPL